MRKVPLWLQVMLAVALGAALGAVAGREPIALGITTESIGAVGMLVIRLLKTLAVPLVLFSIVDAFLRFSIKPAQLGRLVAICAVNGTVALAIGLVVVNVFDPSALLAPHFQGALASGAPAAAAAPATGALASLDALVPKSVLDPIIDGAVLPAALVALLAGAALRRVRAAQQAAGESGHVAVEGIVRTCTEALTVALGWVVLAIPYAAFCLVAQSVGRSGLGVFADLWLFLVTIAGAMALHALGWYSLCVRLAGKSPRAFFRAARDALLTGLATNSSLATVPVTLRGLDELGVSPESARLAALAGTNLNNDGISLYEVMAALIIAQACGLDLGLGAQAALALAALTAAAGIAGIPEAGLVMLPLVLGATGLPESVIALAVPLVVPVDWILARCRTVLNVLADMTVATVLDRTTRGAAEPATVPVSSR